MELYGKVEPSGEPIPIDIEPFDINDAILTASEIRTAVKGLPNSRADGVSGIKLEHMNQWLCDAVHDKDQGDEDLGNKWSVFVNFIQTIWEKGKIP